MLTKEQFRERVKAYCEFQKYLDKLNDLGLNLWEVEELEYFADNYVNLLHEAMGISADADSPGYDDITYLLYENYNSCTNEDIDETYHTVMSSKKYVPGVVRLKPEPLLFNFSRAYHWKSANSEGTNKTPTPTSDWYEDWVRRNFGDF